MIRHGFLLALGFAAASSFAEPVSPKTQLLSLSGQEQLPAVTPVAGKLVLASADVPPRIVNGIDVTVTVGPTCGGPERPGRTCYKPLEGVAVAACPADGRRIRCQQAHTDANGKLTLALPPGKYTVTGEEKKIGIPRGGRGQSPSAEVAVVSREIAPVRLNYDTGMR